MRLFILLLLLSIAPCSYGQSGKDKAESVNSDTQSAATTGDASNRSTALQETSSASSESEANNQKSRASEGSKPFMSHAEWIMAILTAVYVILTGFYVYYSRRTLQELQRQIGLIEKQETTSKSQIDIAQKSADAALLNAQAVVNAERPFIIAYTKGERNSEIWIRNCGKSPAQLLYCDPIAMRYKYPKWDQEMQDWALPQPPHYGDTYELGEQMNIAWLAPGERRCFASVDEFVFKMIPDDIRNDLNAATRAIRIYSAIRYRGIITDTVYETRFCYGWSKDNGTHLAGSYGYNKNT